MASARAAQSDQFESGSWLLHDVSIWRASANARCAFCAYRACCACCVAALLAPPRRVYLTRGGEIAMGTRWPTSQLVPQRPWRL